MYYMKNNKSFLYAILSMLAISSLVACGGNKSKFVPAEDDDEEVPLEVGDTVKEWRNSSKYEGLPMDVPEGITGTREIVKDFGNDDKVSLHFSVKASSSGTGYIDSALVAEPLFTEDDGKNGDIISLFVYIPSNSNLAELKLEILSSATSSWNSTNQDSFEGTKITVNDEKEEKWIRLEGSFDSLNTFGSVRLNYTPVDTSKEAEFYVDDINITYGEETVKTEYTSIEGESLYKKYEDYFIVGTELSASMVKNTKYRQITKEQFSSVTAENEAKPQNTLDQAACQELAKTDPKGVAIKISPFEQIYSWCEANHIKVRHHTFVWHDQTPDWFFREGYQSSGSFVNRETMLGRLNNFFKVTIETLDERWPGLVYALDVVNEAIPEANQIRNSNWMTTVGEDYIYQAFVAASRHKKDYMDLYYNDYSFEQTQYGGVDRCHSAVDNILKKGIDEGLIDGVGIQSHIEFSDVDTVLEDARIIHAAGVKCQITELDVNCNGESEFEAQADAYKKLVKGILEGNTKGTMSVNAIIVWGISDNLSWHSNRSPLMFKSDYSKKPAYYGFLNALDEFLEENEIEEE